jgi:hypothetical protein
MQEEGLVNLGPVLIAISGLLGSVGAAWLATLPSKRMIARHPRVVSLVAYVAGLDALGLNYRVYAFRAGFGST